MIETKPVTKGEMTFEKLVFLPQFLFSLPLILFQTFPFIITPFHKNVYIMQPIFLFWLLLKIMYWKIEM